MAVILKCSRLALRINELHRGSKVFSLKKVALLNSLTNKQFCSVTKTEIAKESVPKNDSRNSFAVNNALLDFQMTLKKRHYIDLKKFDLILEMLKQEEDITLHESYLLIKLCGSSSFILKGAEREKLVENVFSTLEGMGVKLTISHYDTLLSVYLQSNTKVSYTKFFATLQKKGIDPSELTFQRLLKIFCFLGDMNQASELLEIMKNQQVSIGEDVFNSLVYGHGKLGDMQSAIEILNIMEKKGLQPSAETYSNLICGYVVQENVNEIENIFEKCKEQQIIFQYEDLLHILYVMATENKTSYINNIIPEIKQKKGYSTVTQNYILRLLECECDDTVFKLLESLEEKFIKLISGNFILKYFCKYRSARDISVACDILNKGCEFNTYSLAAETLAKIKDDTKFLHYIHSLKSRNMNLHVNYFWPVLISAKQKSSSHVFKVLEKMRKMGVLVDHKTLDRIILPNFVFGSNLLQDLENFLMVDVKADLICQTLVSNLFRNKNIDTALKIARMVPLNFNVNYQKNSFFRTLEYVNDAETIVTFLHTVLHDFYNTDGSLKPLQEEEEVKSETEAEAEAEGETENETETVPVESKKPFQEMAADKIDQTSFAGLTVTKWIDINSPNEASVLEVLKNMLDLKIRISKQYADLIQNNFKSTEIKGLLNQLTDENLKMQLNDEILSSKDKFLNAVKINQLIIDKLTQVKQLVINNQVEEAMNMLNQENFSDLDDNIRYGKYYKQFMSQLLQLEKFEEVQKAFSFGIEMKFLEPLDKNEFVTYFLRRDKYEEAVDMYCKMSEATQSLRLWDVVGKKVVELNNSDLLQKLVNTFSKVKNEEVALAHLIAIFTIAMKKKEINKVIDSVSAANQPRTMNYVSNIFLKKNREEPFHFLLSATASIPPEVREPIYKHLAMLYIQQRNIGKMEDLVFKLHEENIIPSSRFAELLKKFCNKTKNPASVDESLVLAEAV